MPPNHLISSAEAQRLVQRIARGYGWISQKARDGSDPEALEAIQLLQEGYGISVNMYATFYSRGPLANADVAAD